MSHASLPGFPPAWPGAVRARAARPGPCHGPGRLLALLLACASWACAAPRPEDQGDPLPFHVAVVPLLEDDVQPEAPAGEPRDGDEDVVRIELSCEAVSLGVVRALDGRVFTAASLLPSEPGTAAGDADWVDRAQALGADLLLYCERVRYAPEVPTRRVNFLSSSLPLFLLGGPFVYYINDRGYEVEARLSARLYDLHEIRHRRERGGGPLELEKHVGHEAFDAHPDPIRLNFSQRIHSDDLGAWGASLVVPTGFLEADNQLVRAAVAERAIDSIGANLASAIRGRSREILRPVGGRASFHIEPGSFVADLDQAGVLQVRAKLALQRSKNTAALARARLLVGGEAVEGSCQPVPGGDEGLQRYVFAARAELAGAPAGSARPRSLQIEVVDRGTVSNTRSWTFPMPPMSSGSPGTPGSPGAAAPAREGPR